MAGTLKYVSHANFGLGMIQDSPRHLLPDGAVWDASNIVITRSGSLAKRGASTSAILAKSSIVPKSIGAQKSAAGDGLSKLYALSLNGSTGVTVSSLDLDSTQQPLYSFNSSLTTNAFGANPVVFGDSCVFSLDGPSTLAFCGGMSMQNAVEHSAASVSIAITAGSNSLPVGASIAPQCAVGGYVHLSIVGTSEYTGRITAKDATTITVDPPPVTAFTATSFAFYPVLPMVGTRSGLSGSNGAYPIASGCVGTFSSGRDTRLLLGDVTIFNTTGNTATRYPNRVMWSAREKTDAATPNCDGLIQATRGGWPQLNYIDIEDIDKILALVPIGSGNLLVVGGNQCVMLSGALTTQIEASATNLAKNDLSVSIRAFPQRVGCLSAKSVQSTSKGVMFASRDGVYITDGSKLVNTMDGRISNFWTENNDPINPIIWDASLWDGPDVWSANAANDAVNGSANINDSHYFISMAKQGFFCDMRSGFAWTRVPASELQIGGSVVDPEQTSNRVYAFASNYTASSDSSMDRIMRLDPVVIPSSGVIDADGTGFTSFFETRAYVEGDPAQKRRFRHLLVTFQAALTYGLFPSSTLYPAQPQLASGLSVFVSSASLYPSSLYNAGFTVDAWEGLDPDTSTTPVSTSNTTSSSTTSQTVRYDSQVISNAVSYRVTTTGTPSSLVFYEFTNAFNQLRPGRVSD
jgi:hypothetical protein